MTDVKDKAKVAPKTTEPKVEVAKPTPLELSETKLKEARKELAKVRRELKITEGELEIANKKAAAYFNKYKVLQEKSTTNAAKIASSLDMLGDSMNLGMKQLKQAFLTASQAINIETEGE